MDFAATKVKESKRRTCKTCQSKYVLIYEKKRSDIVSDLSKSDIYMSKK